MLNGVSQKGFEHLTGNHTHTVNGGDGNQYVALSGNGDEYISHEDDNEASNELTQNITENLGEQLTLSIISALGGIFSPLLSFIKNLSDSQNIINNFSSLLQSAEQNVNGQGLLSRESKQALDELSNVVSTLQNNHSGTVDLGAIIARWRESGDAQHLLHMAEHLERGECISLNENELRELREVFIRGLRILARAIRDAENRGESYALEHLHDAADPLVCGVERAHQACHRENTRLTYEDRRFMGERLQECCDHVNEGIQNGVFSGLEHAVVDELNDWISYMYDFLRDFFEEIEEEREEEEKVEKEKQCKKRCEEKEEIRFLHALHKRAENEKLRFLSFMKKARMEANIAFAIARAELNNPVGNRARYNREIERANREYNRSLSAENSYGKYASSESLYEGMEEGIYSQLPPPSVCEPEFPSYSFNLDYHS